MISIDTIFLFLLSRMICNSCSQYYRDILVFVCGCCSLVAVLSLLTIYHLDLNIIRRRLSTSETHTTADSDVAPLSNSKHDNESRPLLP